MSASQKRYDELFEDELNDEDVNNDNQTNNNNNNINQDWGESLDMTRTQQQQIHEYSIDFNSDRSAIPPTPTSAVSCKLTQLSVKSAASADHESLDFAQDTYPLADDHRGEIRRQVTSPLFLEESIDFNDSIVQQTSVEMNSNKVTKESIDFSESIILMEHDNSNQSTLPSRVQREEDLEKVTTEPVNKARADQEDDVVLLETTTDIGSKELNTNNVLDNGISQQSEDDELIGSLLKKSTSATNTITTKPKPRKDSDQIDVMDITTPDNNTTNSDFIFATQEVQPIHRRRLKRRREIDQNVSFAETKKQRLSKATSDEEEEGEHEIDFSNSQDYREMIQEDGYETPEEQTFLKAGYELRVTPTRKRQNVPIITIGSNSSKSDTLIEIVSNDVHDSPEIQKGTINDVSLFEEEPRTPSPLPVVPQASNIDSRTKTAERKKRLDAFVQTHGSSKKRLGGRRRLEKLFDEEEEVTHRNATSEEDDDPFAFDSPMVEKKQKKRRESNRKDQITTESLEDFIVPDDEELTQYSSSEYEIDEEGEEEEQENEPESQLLNVSFDQEESQAFDRSKPVWVPGLTHKSERESYMIMVQYLLSCMLDPEFESFIRTAKDDTYFTPALLKIFNKLDTNKSSLVSSSVWTQEFMEHLHMFPRLKHNTISRSSKDCQVCRRKGHHATVTVQFEGHPIDQQFYELVQCGTIITVEDVEAPETYYIGRYCFRRVVLYHVMHHYKNFLFKWLQKLIAAAKKKRSKDDSEHLDPKSIIEVILDSKDVSRLYDGYKELLKLADKFANSDWNAQTEGLDAHRDVISIVFPIGVHADRNVFPNSSSSTPKKNSSRRPKSHAKMNRLEFVRHVSNSQSDDEGDNREEEEIIPNKKLLTSTSTTPSIRTFEKLDQSLSAEEETHDDRTDESLGHNSKDKESVPIIVVDEDILDVELY